MSVAIESKKVVFRQGRAWELLPIGNQPTTVLKLIGTADFQPFSIAGTPAVCTGSLLVKHGYIKAIRSGNETARGSEPELIDVLQSLRSSGADLSGSWVIDFDGTHAVTAAEFIAKGGAWPARAQ